MPLPKDGEIQLFQVVDTDGNPARVSLIAGVYRLAVDALLVGPAGAYAQGDFDSVAVDEANALAMWVRAATTGLDTTQAVASRNVPIAARAALAAQAYTLERLLTDGVIRVDDGTTYSAMAGRGAVAAQAYTLIRGLTDSASRFDSGADWAAGLVRQSALTLNETLNHILVRAAITANDSSAAGGSQNVAVQARGAVAAQAYTLQRLCADAVVRGDDGTTYSAVVARNLDAAADVTAALIGLLVNSRNTIFRQTTQDWALWDGDAFDNVAGASTGVILGAYVTSMTLGVDTTGANVLRTVEARGAVAAQAYTLQRLFTDAVIRGDDGTTYSAIAARSATVWNGSALSLILQGTAAVEYINDLGSSVFGIVSGDAANAISGRLPNVARCAYSAAIATGLDNTGATVLRPVEARAQAASNNAQFARALNGLLVSARQRSLDQGVTATGVSGAAVTLTLPAPGLNLKQFILEITITKFSAAVLVAAAAPVIVTTTNLTGNPSYDFQANAALQGTIERVQVLPSLAIEATAENTAVTIVCPATTDVIWRVSVRYYNA